MTDATSGEDYVPGDVNTTADVDELNVDDMAGNRVDDMAGNRAEGGTPSTVLTYLARALASDPDSVVVETDPGRGGTRLRLFVAQEDMGRVIGRRGRTAQAIRALVAAAGARDGVTTSVDIVD